MSFRKQIKEDIKIIQEEYGARNHKLFNEDYAFNHWVLSRLYSIDDDMIVDNITEYHDDGADCYVFFEDEKQLYLIQNKFYGENTKINFRYVKDDFINKLISTLESNSYRRNADLQGIFNKYINDDEFKVSLRLYVTNNLKNEKVNEYIKSYKNVGEHPYYSDAKIFYLNDINTNYFDERIEEVKNRYYKIKTVNSKTVMEIKENYPFTEDISAKYVFTPVEEIYGVLKSSKEKNHNIFSENIREYLGNKGINTNIAATLDDEKDRSNFFFYNNGITIICEDIESYSIRGVSGKELEIKMTNPQIVNGCQTCNSIFEVLDKETPDNIEKKFKDTFVMTKILTIENDEDNVLRESIVRYNNSQNKIDDKHFEANKRIYQAIKKEFFERGLLLATKQSDEYQYKQKYKRNYDQFTTKIIKRSEKFGLDMNKLVDLVVPLEKMLQVLVAFYMGPLNAFQKKSHVLKIGTKINEDLGIILRERIGVNHLVDLYLLYLKAFKENQKNKKENSPIPYYLIGFIGRTFKPMINDLTLVLDKIFESKTSIDNVYNYFKQLSDVYKTYMIEEDKYEYNKMIKTEINEKRYKDAELALKISMRDEYSFVKKLENEFI